MQPDAAALKTCCTDALAARNGHGRRWAVARCVRALQALPSASPSPVLDELAGRAMVAVADTINRNASSPLGPSA